MRVFWTAEQAPGDSPAMHFRGAVIDPEGTRLAENALDDCVAGDPKPTEDLHASVGDAEYRLRIDDLCHRTLGRGSVTLVQQPSGMPDQKPRRADVHLIVGQHEA